MSVSTVPFSLKITFLLLEKFKFERDDFYSIRLQYYIDSKRKITRKLNECVDWNATRVNIRTFVYT